MSAFKDEIKYALTSNFATGDATGLATATGDDLVGDCELEDGELPNTPIQVPNAKIATTAPIMILRVLCDGFITISYLLVDDNKMGGRASQAS
jgi:hypothetical protein